jgi:tetratricopeptide (TPR) repeat protein
MKSRVDGVLFYLLIAGLMAIGLAVDPFTSTPFRDEKDALLRGLGGIAGLGVAVLFFQRGFPREVWSGLACLAPVIALAGWRTFQSLRDPWAWGVVEPGLPVRADFLLRVLAPYLAAIFLWCGASLLRMSPGRARMFQRVLLLLLVIEEAGALIEVVGEAIGKAWHPFLGVASVAAGQVGLKTEIFGSLGNTNFLASFLAILVFPALGGCLSMRGPFKRGLGLMACLLAVCLIILCRSKGSLLAVGGGMGVFGGLYGFSRRKDVFAGCSSAGGILVGGILLAAMLVMAPAAMRHSGEGFFEAWRDALRLRGESSSQRILLAYTALTMWEDSKTLGIGPGEFRLKFIPEVSHLLESQDSEAFRGRIRNLKSFRPIHVHNDYLELLVEWGWIGYGAVMAFGMASAGRGLRNLRSEAGHMFWLRLGCMAGVAAGLVYAFFEFPFSLPSHLALLSVLVGFAASPSLDPSGYSGEGPKWGRLAGGLLLAAPALLLLYQGAALYAASRAAREAVDLSTGKPSDRDRAASLAKRAVQLDPGNAELALSLAQIQWRVEGQASSARNSLRRVSRISDDPNVMLVEAEILLEEEKYDDAARAIEPLRVIGRFLPGVGFFEGRIAEARGRYEASAEAYSRDLSACADHPDLSHPNLPNLLLRYGGVLERMGRYREALEQYRRQQDLIASRGTNIPLALLRMGRIYRDHLQDYSSARKAFEEAQASARKSGNSGESANAEKELRDLRTLLQGLKTDPLENSGE